MSNKYAISVLERHIIRAYEDRMLFNSERFQTMEERSKYIQNILKIRKHILDKLFEYNDENKYLLNEFNQTLIKTLLDVQERVTKLSRKHKDFRFEGICKVGNLSSVHPDQSDQRRTLFEALANEGVEYLCPADSRCVYRVKSADKYDSVEDFLYGGQPYYWAEGMDEEWAKELGITWAAHNLFGPGHGLFALYDLLYLRDYDCEIRVVYESGDIYYANGIGEVC